MADVQSTIGGFGASAGQGLVITGLVIVGIVFALIIGGLIVWWMYNKKRWNLRVEIKLLRSDGKYVGGEWGKGAYNAKRGVCYIKREGFNAAKIPMKIFDLKTYLQGSDLLTVVQMGPEDYRPILPHSFLHHQVEYVDDKTGETKVMTESIMNLKIDDGADKAWKASWDAAAKKAYSLQSFFTQFQTPIAIGIVIICCFVGFAILYSKIPAAG